MPADSKLSRVTSAPDGEICVCDISGDDLDVSGPTISHHLKVLREAGLIDGERRGTWIYYRGQPSPTRHPPRHPDPDPQTLTPSGFGCTELGNFR